MSDTFSHCSDTQNSKSTLCYQRRKHRPDSAADLCSVENEWEEFPKCQKKQLLGQQWRRNIDLRTLHPEQDIETIPS